MSNECIRGRNSCVSGAALKLSACVLIWGVSSIVHADIYYRFIGNHSVVLSNRNATGALRPIVVATGAYRSSTSGLSNRADKPTRPARDTPAAIDGLIQAAASRHNVDPLLLKAVISVESAFVANAISPKGAVGLMQVIPATAAQYGVTADNYGSITDKLADPETNVSTGAQHLRSLLERFPGDLSLALAAYNAGEGAVARNGNRTPPYPETQRYVRDVLARYDEFSTKHRH